MKERNVDVDETALHVAKECPSKKHVREAVYRASIPEAREKLPTCFWCAGIAPRDNEVHESNISPRDFNYDEPDPPRRTEADVAAEWHRPDHHGRYRMVVAGDGACSKQSTHAKTHEV